MTSKTTKSLAADALAVLKTSNPVEKASLASSLVERWGSVSSFSVVSIANPPLRPSRPDLPLLLPPGKVPRRRINRGVKGRIALLHALAHIELNAVDLACDIIVRFGYEKELPTDFYKDWAKVASDEGRHFLLLSERLEELGATYGDLPAHDGLWEAAENTANNLLARLAIVPLVLEARGLDVTPPMINKLRSVEDQESAAILDIIHRDEIRHVAIGQRWFDHLCDKQNLDPVLTFHNLVKHYFKGALRPPFNKSSRDAAGMPPAFYDVEAISH